VALAASGGSRPAMVVLRDVTKRYGPHAAVDQVSLTVDAGTTHVLLGSSGSGKSTILRLALGLVPADEGTVIVDGILVGSVTRSEVVRRCGYVVQEGALYPHLTVARNVTLAARAHGWSEERMRSRLTVLGELTGLDPSLFGRYPSELSGGQRQRVGLMRALMLDPPVLFLDEPLGALDPIIRADLQLYLARIFRELAKTVVLVTHDIREAFVFGSTITLLHGGRIVQQGSFADLARRPADPFVAEFLRAQTPPPEMTESL
jgi:osmoprotectant transport system ATP-binding protein